MPARQADEFKLGLTVLIIIALFFGTIVFIGGAGAWGRKTQTIQVRFDHEFGLPVLKTGGEVRCGGQQVGSIQKVELQELPASPGAGEPTTAPVLAESQPRLVVVVTIEVDTTVGLRQDCEIVAEGPTLGGSGWLIIRDRGTSAVAASGDKPITGQPPGGFAAIADNLAEMGANLSAELDPKNPDGLLATVKIQLDAALATSLLGKIHRSLDDINVMTAAVEEQLDVHERQALLAKLNSSMDDFNLITGELRRQMDPKADRVVLSKIHGALDALGGALDQAVGMLEENREPIHETIAHIRSTAQKLDERIAEAIANQLDVRNHASLMAKIHLDVDRIGQSLADINQITADTRQIITLNKPAIERTLANIKQTSDHLKAASKDLRRNPWRLLYQPSEKETRELNIFDAARAYADAATQLDDASSRLEALAKASQPGIAPDDPDLLDVRRQLKESFEKFSQVESALWSILKLR